MVKVLSVGFYIASSFGIFASAQVHEFGKGVVPRHLATGLTILPDLVHWANCRGEHDSLVVESMGFRTNGALIPNAETASNGPVDLKSIDPFVSPDRRKLLFTSNRHPTENLAKPDFDIWAVDLDRNGKPGLPSHLGPVINSDSADFFATMSSNGNIYFASTRTATTGDVDLYFSEWCDGNYLAPVRLPSPVNSGWPDSNPYISPDERFLIFLRDSPDGYGDSDLYISFKSEQGWSEPVNLGPEINTPAAEFGPFFDSEKKIFAFGRLYDRKPYQEHVFFVINFDPHLFARK